MSSHISRLKWKAIFAFRDGFDQLKVKKKVENSMNESCATKQPCSDETPGRHNSRKLGF